MQPPGSLPCSDRRRQRFADTLGKSALADKRQYVESSRGRTHSGGGCAGASQTTGTAVTDQARSAPWRFGGAAVPAYPGAAPAGGSSARVAVM
jgi:hypothetical protein